MLFQKSHSRVITVLIHILVWVVFGLTILFLQPLTTHFTLPYQFWVKQALVLLMLVATYYFNSLVVVPRLLLKNHIWYYLLAAALIVVCFMTINAYADDWLNIPALMEALFSHGHPEHHHHPKDWHFDSIGFVVVALVLGISTSITAIQKWQADQQLHLVLQQEKTSSELSFLKAQINPHFFFNTLNNIYALTYVDAEVSRKAIHQLSRMMRYLLYDTPQAHPLLSQELDFIKDYISLMQLRLTGNAKINFEVPAIINDLPIASMIFLPFVENAFKHGISATEPSHIDIGFVQNEKQLEFSVANSIIKNQSPIADDYGGIGLSNTRRRLHLLYPGKHKLVINKANNANEYIVHLTLDLS